MSHFPVMVLVAAPQPEPRSVRGVKVATVGRNMAAIAKDDLEKLVEPLLAKYDENIEVAPYQRECYCIGMNPARRAADQRARDDVGDPPGGDNDAFVVWERRFDELRAQYRGADPETSKPKPDCDECKGTGMDTTTYNPLSKWDWYQVGGRWDGIYPNNCQSVSALLARTDNEWITSAMLTPDGDWHQQGRMGWFGIMTDRQTDADWYDEVRGTMRQHPKAMVVIVDCHI